MAKKKTTQKKAATKKGRKTTKKTSAKKKTRKTTKNSRPSRKTPMRVEVMIRKKILGKAPEEHSFVLHDGTRLRSVHELVDTLDTMSDDLFRHYVNEAKNDFASWIRHVFDDEELASDLEEAQTKIDTQFSILRKLVKELHQEARKR